MSFSNTDDIIDIRDIIARVEELREQRVTRYIAGWNMPGYMPDSEPAEFDDLDNARTYIADQIREQADELETEADGAKEDDKADILARAVSLREDADTLESSDDSDFAATLAGVAYWITQDGTMGIDEEETAELDTLESLLSECEGMGGDEQWEGNWYPVTLIRDSYFTDYAQELCVDIGAVPKDIPSYIEIDWEATARNIQMDYSSVEFDGVTYWMR